MRTKVLNVLAAVALFGAVAATAQAWAEEAREFDWGKVKVDGSYAAAHPDQVGLEGVVADVRESVSDHEERISRLEGRVGALEKGRRKPTAPPSGGEDTSGANAPQKGGASMSAGAIVAITGGSMIFLILLTLIVVGLFRLRGGTQPALNAFQQALNSLSGNVAAGVTTATGDSVTVRGCITQPQNATPVVIQLQGATLQLAPAPAPQPPAPAPPAPVTVNQEVTLPPGPAPAPQPPAQPPAPAP